MQKLIRGERKPLADLTSKSQITFSVQVEGPEPSRVVPLALLLDDQQRAMPERAAIGSALPKSEDGAIVFSKDRSQSFEIDLSRVSSAISHVLFVVGIQLPSGQPGTFQEVRSARWAVGVSGRDLVGSDFKGADFSGDGAVALAEIYRKSGVWRLRSVGEGYVGGLATLLSRFGIPFRTVDESRATPMLSSSPAGSLWLPRGWPGERAPAIPQGLASSVGLIICRTADGTVHTGTGFAISPGGYFITCHHVVCDAVEISICFDGTQLLRKAEIAASDSESDLALCWISDRNGCHEWNRLAPNDSSYPLGEELGLLGYPLGVELGIHVTYSQGIVNSLRKNGPVSVLQIDVGAAPGSSGAPVFRRRDGHVVGVLSSGLRSQHSGMLINFAVDMQNLWRLGWITPN